MPLYHQLGSLPSKRHQVFRQPSGELYCEELIGNMGFSGPASLLYHVNPPTAVRSVRHLLDLKWDKAPAQPVRHRHFRTRVLDRLSSAITGRIPILFNRDVALSVVCPEEAITAFYRNAQGDEVIFVADGIGALESPFGRLPFRGGDYLVIPRGIVHRYRFDAPARLLVIESAGYVRTPKRYRNEFGQLLEHSPYCERDIRRPRDLETYTVKGDQSILVKKDHAIHELILAHHPFDLIGWDGYYYPWAISIHDFEPRVGRFHLPPPIHQMFDGDGFVICSFCPRPYDFDPTAVPAPYAHSNVMSDEVLYYANSEFMSRRGIEYASITLHPDGLPHGPQPGRTEDSIGVRNTAELAVMVDTFRPLHVSAAALDAEDQAYHRSWLPD